MSTRPGVKGNKVITFIPDSRGVAGCLDTMHKSLVNSPLLDEDDTNESFEERERLNSHAEDESQNVNSREQTAEDQINEDHEQGIAYCMSVTNASCLYTIQISLLLL